MQQQIAMRLYRRASICHRRHRPALQHVQQVITVRARRCITTVLADVQVVVRVSTVHRVQMRRLTVPASVRVAMEQVHPVHVRRNAQQVRTALVVRQHVRIVRTSQITLRTPVPPVIHLRRVHGPATVVIIRRRITSVASSVVRG